MLSASSTISVVVVVFPLSSVVIVVLIFFLGFDASRLEKGAAQAVASEVLDVQHLPRCSFPGEGNCPIDGAAGGIGGCASLLRLENWPCRRRTCAATANDGVL